jgi:hypothetical protein
MVMYILVENCSYILGKNNYFFAYILRYKSFFKLYFCLQKKGTLNWEQGTDKKLKLVSLKLSQKKDVF